MLIKPPIITQPQPINKNNSVLEEKNIQSIPNKTESGTIITKEITPIVSNDKDKELQFIRKKREYKAFIKLVKKGKFTTALFTAQILNVERNTIIEWLRTRKVREAMDEEVTHYVNNIKSSKDWKASAYLLDKALPQQDKDSPTHDINSLIVINT